MPNLDAIEPGGGLGGDGLTSSGIKLCLNKQRRAARAHGWRAGADLVHCPAIFDGRLASVVEANHQYSGFILVLGARCSHRGRKLDFGSAPLYPCSLSLSPRVIHHCGFDKSPTRFQ